MDLAPCPLSSLSSSSSQFSYRNLVPSQNREGADQGECQDSLVDIIELFLSDLKCGRDIEMIDMSKAI